MASEYSDQEHEQIIDLTENWYKEFEHDDLFLNLASQNQEHAGFIIRCFTDYMYNYQGATPKEWNVGDMKKVC
ncbi:MAG: hypothetical protein HQK49_08120 [Oligoflexia bacterium]|nr:hypothetical protein [Oligoflexia bacterium]